MGTPRKAPTMRRVILPIIVAAIVALTSADASGQIPNLPNGCAKCGARGYVDVPPDPASQTSVPVVAHGADWLVAGWAFECVSGRLVDRVDLYASNDDGTFAPVPWWRTELTTGIPRPDVTAAFQSACPNVRFDAGYGLRVMSGAVPSGTRVIRAIAWSGPYVHISQRVIVFK